MSKMKESFSHNPKIQNVGGEQNEGGMQWGIRRYEKCSMWEVDDTAEDTGSNLRHRNPKIRTTVKDLARACRAHPSSHACRALASRPSSNACRIRLFVTCLAWLRPSCRRSVLRPHPLPCLVGVKLVHSCIAACAVYCMSLWIRPDRKKLPKSFTYEEPLTLTEIRALSGDRSCALAAVYKTAPKAQNRKRAKGAKGAKGANWRQRRQEAPTWRQTNGSPALGERPVLATSILGTT